MTVPTNLVVRSIFNYRSKPDDVASRHANQHVVDCSRPPAQDHAVRQPGAVAPRGGNHLSHTRANRVLREHSNTHYKVQPGRCEWPNPQQDATPPARNQHRRAGEYDDIY